MDVDRREKLVGDLRQIGISEYSARSAIKHCEWAILVQGGRWALAAGVAGAGLGVVGGRPDIGGLVGLVSGAAIGMNRAIDSDSCGPADWSTEAQQKLRREMRRFSGPVNDIKDLINP